MKKQIFRSLAVTALLAGIILPVVACTTALNEVREVAAERIARPAFMVERRLSTGGMNFQLWERMHNRFEPANIYIEGDGNPTYLGRTITDDSTPENPVGLHLASRDNANNLVYMSRPCQYLEEAAQNTCDIKFWSTRRFSPEVLAAYNEALDEIKLRYDITEFNLIGYDGGANIAAQLATVRKDVVSLRTVAGNLNPKVVFGERAVLEPDNILAIDIAPGLARIPQHHFVGAGDEVTPPSVYHSFRQAMGDSKCVHYTMVQDADHERGWVEKWPQLLKSSVECEKEHIPVALPPLPPSKDGPNK